MKNHRTCRHDTEKLPCGGFYFAPGVIDDAPRPGKRLSGWMRLARDVAVLLATAALIGFAAGVVQAKGWPL